FFCLRSRSTSSCCRASTAFRRSASPCNFSRWRRYSFWPPVSWARRWVPGSSTPRLRRSSSSARAFHSFSWPAFPGRAKRSPSPCLPRAPYSPRTSPSTASSASISWAPACGRWRMTGVASGPLPLSTSCLRRFPRFSSSGGARMPSRKPARIVALGGLLVGAGVGGYFIWRPEAAAPIVGVVRTTEVRVAPEVAGQLAAIKVQKGASVRAGDVVAELYADELIASVAQARAALAAAKADRDNVYAGVRAEERAGMAAEIAKAKSRLEYAEQQFARTSYLARSDTATQQALDQATNDVASARADVAEAQANYDAAQAGPTPEERAIADAQVKAASAALAVLE